MSDTRNKTYFVYPHPLWVGTITFGLWLTFMARFFPNNIPALLGPVGRFGTYVGVTYPVYMNYICIAALCIHFTEALLTLRICRKRNMETMTTAKWTIQTFFFGFSSLIRLVSQKKLDFIPGSTKTKAK